MPSMNVSTRDLRAVVALIDEKNFTRAAQRCHLSQSAFSTLIRGVEESLGARLFDRTTRSVELTAEGRLFEVPARQVLADLDDMVEDFRDYATKRKGRVAVAALPSIAAGWLPGIFADFRLRHPGVELALFDVLSDQCISLLRAGRVDMAIASAGPLESDLQTEKLCSDRFHLVCPRAHPLASRPSVRLKDLAEYPFVQLARTSSVRQHLDAALHPLQMRTVFEVEQLPTVTALVEAGLGITVVPAMTLFHFIRRPALRVRPIKALNLMRRIYIVRRRGHSLSVAAQGLHELMLSSKPQVYQVA